MIDFFPILRHLPQWVFGANFRKRMAESRKICDDAINLPFEYTKNNLGGAADTGPMAAQQLHRNDESEEIVKWAFGTLYSAGYETMVASMTAFMLAMLRYPDVQRKAQAELDAVIGAALPGVRDRASLPYIDALLIELLRWWPALPTGVPHVLVTDDVYKGWHIPKGTMVIGNIRAMSYDPRVYPAPERFMPERFLEGRAPDPRAFTFGFGRRKCPADHYSELTMFTCITAILTVFNIEPVERDGRPYIPDMIATSGLPGRPAEFPCRLVPRSEERLQLVRET